MQIEMLIRAPFPALAQILIAIPIPVPILIPMPSAGEH